MWTGGKGDDRAVLGRRWLEFIEPSHVAGLLAWIADETDCESVFEFSAMAPHTGQRINLVYAKCYYEGVCVCVGRVLAVTTPNVLKSSLNCEIIEP